MNLSSKLQRIREWYSGHSKVLIALSGGVDSCLVAYTARKFLGKDNVVSVISHSASLKSRDLNDARIFCEKYDINLEIIDAKELQDPDYAANPVNRCYFCKSALYREINQALREKYRDYEILNGNNQSDLGDYRPGIKAANEFRVFSPLADCGLKKEDIREIAAYYDLFVWNKPASPCLSSRFPYGQAITYDKLRMVEDAEEILFAYGFKESRVRHMGEIARIEVPAKQLSSLELVIDKIKPEIFKIGFKQCEIDSEGLVSGKLNRVLNGEKLSS